MINYNNSYFLNYNCIADSRDEEREESIRKREEKIDLLLHKFKSLPSLDRNVLMRYLLNNKNSSEKITDHSLKSKSSLVSTEDEISDSSSQKIYGDTPQEIDNNLPHMSISSHQRKKLDKPKKEVPLHKKG